MTVSSAPSWSGVKSIQWACALMELLGETSLENLPVVMSGSRAVETGINTAAHAAAIRRARPLIGKVMTTRATRTAVRRLNNAALEQGFGLSYRIGPATLQFTPNPAHELLTEEAKQSLLSPSPQSTHQLDIAPSGDAVVKLRRSGDFLQIPLRLPELSVAPPEQHQTERERVETLKISLAELRVTAQRLDQIDEVAQGQWPAENWVQRLDEVIQIHAVSAGLPLAQELDLTYLTHLIGLPGAGKTTLISLLCAYLAERNLRVAVFFTSIEVAREYLRRLRHYEVSAALLVGNSPQTHRTHAERFAELVAAQGQGGFARTLPEADLFAQNCALPSFAVNEVAAWEQWTLTDVPCDSIFVEEKGKERRVLCPLWSACGRVKNQRDLVSASVWLGHVRSSDTRIPAHTSRERMQYFKFIARNFDLVIFDEVDEAQRVLDDLGSTTLNLGGSERSIYDKTQYLIRQSLSQWSAHAHFEQLQPHQLASLDFQYHLVKLYHAINRLQSAEINLTLQNRLLTTHFIIGEILTHYRIKTSSTRRSAINAFWDDAIFSAYFKDRTDWLRAGQFADALGWSVPEAKERWAKLTRTLRTYLNQRRRISDLRDVLEKLTAQFADLLDPEEQVSRDQLSALTYLTVAVGFTIASYQELVRHSRALAQYDLLPEAVETRTSEALEETVPKNLLGTFSSVRYRVKEGVGGFEIDYLILGSVPRLLMQRMAEQGCHVLLTSATSWFPASPAFHVAVPPQYILTPRPPQEANDEEKQQGPEIAVKFAPIKPLGAKEALRYSGGGKRRLQNLLQMVTFLAQANPSSGLSQLDRAALRMRTKQGRVRACALIVNSYDQVVQVVRQIAKVNPALAAQTRGVMREKPEGALPGEHYVLRGEVESLSQDANIKVLVFAMTSLGRGVNMVFKTADDDPDQGTSWLGTLYFLTRPHPVADDLGLLLSTVARATERFDRETFPSLSLSEISDLYMAERKKVFRSTLSLLSTHLSASRLPDEFLQGFTANLLVPVLQTIGRAIRRGSPAQVYFVDAAWAPYSAEEKPDHSRSSVLVGMQELLDQMVDGNEVMTALYGPFAQAFSEIENLRTGLPLDIESDDDAEDSDVDEAAEGSSFDESALSDDDGNAKHDDDLTYNLLEDQGDLTDDDED